MLNSDTRSMQFAENHNLVVDYLDKTAKIVVKYLYNRTITVSCAESCTGGMLAQSITSVSGASDVFELGICTYSNRMKTEMLGIDAETLKMHGAVSEETACLMAQNVMRLANSDIGVGITGVAGPTQSEGKPVGTVYVAVASKDFCKAQNLRLYEISDKLSRDTIRRLTVINALEAIFSLCKNQLEEGDT